MTVGRPARSSKRHVNYVELGSSDEEIVGELQREVQVLGLHFTTADPRYVGRDIAETGSAVLNVDEVRQILRDEEHTARQNRTVDDKPDGLAPDHPAVHAHSRPILLLEHAKSERLSCISCRKIFLVHFQPCAFDWRSRI
jgi:hypothetical protein